MTKCNFCKYFVGRQCSAAGASGRPNPYYCKQAEYEFNQWKRQQQAKKYK